MNTFSEYSKLNEGLIVLGKERKPYPNFGHAVIFAGGAASGKGTVLKKMLGIEGYIFDADKLKRLVLNSIKLKDKIKKELAIDITALDQADPETWSKLHAIVKHHLKLYDLRLSSLYNSILFANSTLKPNLIFDVTLSKISKFEQLTQDLNELGYDSTNIHLVWVIQDVEDAIQLNIKRGKLDSEDRRTISTEVLINLHRGTSYTIKDIIDLGENLTTKYHFNGDIVFVFNKIGIDSEITVSKLQPMMKKPSGSYVTKMKYFFIKRAGEKVKSIDSVETSIRQKIAEYTPKTVSWI
jgi:hypothetical protein